MGDFADDGVVCPVERGGDRNTYGTDAGWVDLAADNPSDRAPRELKTHRK